MQNLAMIPYFLWLYGQETFFKLSKSLEFRELQRFKVCE